MGVLLYVQEGYTGLLAPTTEPPQWTLLKSLTLVQHGVEELGKVDCAAISGEM
jgi:hypothetical protein